MKTSLLLLSCVLSCILGASLHAGEALKILALGDSYTIGEGVKQGEIWPVKLGAKLRPEGPAPVLSVIAKTGWTTANLQRAVLAVQPQTKGPYDLVTLLIGVNNQYQGREEAEFREQFVDLLKKSIEYANKNAKHVVVVSIPDYSVTPFCEGRDRAAIAKALDRFNAICKEEAEKAGVVYVDITPGSREAAAKPDLLAADGLHPSGKMYAQWADKVFEAVKDEFKK